MKLKFPIVATLALLLSLTGASTVQSQYIWVPYADNPVIDFTFDQTSINKFRPAVLKKDGLIHMWYGKRTGASASSARSVAYATSVDGLDWTIKDLFALEPSGALGTFDELWATNATVVADGDTLRMWYNGSGNLAAGIGYAWSIDGSNWTKVRGTRSGGSVLDVAMHNTTLAGVVTPTVVKVDGTFHMWYARLVSGDGKSRVGYARSTNGLDWTLVPGTGPAESVLDVGAPGSFDANQIWWPWVLHNQEAGIFEMWYEGIDDPEFGGVPRLGCARSDDGVTWQKVSGDGNAGACSNLRAQPGVLLDNGFYRMWYTVTTNVAPNRNEVGYATSVPVSTAIEDSEIPHEASVVSAYPNPFTSDVTLEFALKTPGSISLQVYDMLGRLVFERREAGLSPGSRSLIWNGRYRNGDTAPSGTYFVRLLEDGQGVVGFKTVQLNRQ